MVDTVKTYIIKFDSSAAFGNCLFRIKEPSIPEGSSLSRMAVQIGPLTKVYEGTTLSFPIDVQLDPKESARLEPENPVNILLYDQNGKPQTAVMKDKYIVVAGERKVYDGKCC